MKIESVKIENFRCIKTAMVSFNDYTCFVGANSAGKSNILNALNVFFREPNAGSTDLTILSKEDFHNKDTTSPIRITVTFTDLSEGACVDFKDYVRHGKLVISAIATWDSDTQKAIVKQHGERLAMEAFAPFFELAGKGGKVADLKEKYNVIRKKFPDLPPPTSKTGMEEALRNYEASNPDLCQLLESGDEFYGISKGANRLAKYIQWIFIPAVKDASSEQQEAKDTALGRLIDRTVRASVNFEDKIKEICDSAILQYNSILSEKQSALLELSEKLKLRLCEWATPDAKLEIKWDQDSKKAIKVEPPYAKIITGDENFMGEVARMGHGMQRSYMFALLHELSLNNGENVPKLLLAIEEPELFQHPQQVLHLSEVLMKLSEGNAQVFICSHNPIFINGKGFEDVRLVRKNGITSTVSSLTFEDLSRYLTSRIGPNASYKKPEGVRAKINQSLRPCLREMFFAQKIVLVEGLEELAYITTTIYLNNKINEWRKRGLCIIPVDGKSYLKDPLAIAQLLKIPVFIIFDSDGDCEEKHKSKHEKDNRELFALLGIDSSPFPPKPLYGTNYIVWDTNLTKKVEEDYESDEWNEWKHKAEIEHGQAKNLKKNSMYIASIMELAWAAGKPSKTLTEICEKLLSF